MRNPMIVLVVGGAFLGGMAFSRSPQPAAAASDVVVSGSPAPIMLVHAVGKSVAVQIRGDQILGNGGTLREVRGKLVEVNDDWIAVETDGNWEKGYPTMMLPLSAVSGVFVAAKGADK